MPRKILVLGGTGEARELATLLLEDGHDVESSLAGVTQTRLMPEGKVRLGGFGGEQGLFEYLQNNRFAAVADATHPYAATISKNAYSAARRAGLCYCRLERPAWQAEPADRWIAAASAAEAASLLPPGARVFLATGRSGIKPFMARLDLSGLVRMIEIPPDTIAQGWTLILARPPFAIEAELGLMKKHGISHLVSKNSGGDGSYAKLVAARETKIPVVMIARPVKPGAPALWPAKALVTTLCRMLSP